MEIDKLFFIPLEIDDGNIKGKYYILYVPLHGVASIVSDTEKQSLENKIYLARGDYRQVEALNNIIKMPERLVQMPPDNIEDVYEIDILANYMCNFNCIYCYSARGRSQVELKYEVACRLIDFLFGENHPADKPYRINFSGGGEPLISFELIKKIIAYIEAKAEHSNHKYILQLVTNGSLVKKEHADFFKQHSVNLVVSFAVLEKFQNRERGAYDRVVKTIDMLLDNGNKFGIRATITDESVYAMPQMVAELHRRFPRLRTLVFDTVLSSDMFLTSEKLAEYYNRFLQGFCAAKETGERLGVEIHSTPIQLLEFIRTRTCFGKMVLTPLGSLSVCARVSSPVESEYGDFIYGSIDSTKGLVVDRTKFSSYMHEDTIESSEECKTCYARLHCGGGCRLFRHCFNEESVKVDCDFKRRVVKMALLARIENELHASKGITLTEFISRNLTEGIDSVPH